MTFQEHIVLTLIESLAIALVVAVAGFVLSKFLEKYKSGLELSRVIAERRIKEIDLCVTALNQWNATVETFISKYSKFHTLTADEKLKVKSDLQALKEKSSGQSSSIRDTVELSRFWIGEHIYVKCRDYFNCIDNGLTAFSENDLKNFVDLKENTARIRGEIASEILKLG